MGLTTSDWISGAALLVALAALGISYCQFRVARRATNVAEQNLTIRNRPIDLYLVDAWIVRDSDADCRRMHAVVRFTNMADVPNSVGAADLAITYVLRGGDLVTQVVEHDASFVDVEGSEIDRIDIPFGLEARGACTGKLVFALPKTGERVAGVDSYVVRAFDAESRCSEVQPYVMREFST